MEYELALRSKHISIFEKIGSRWETVSDKMGNKQ